MAKMKFNPKDTKYKTLPKSASPKSPNEPDEYADHSYDHRETRPDGSVVYYYENGWLDELEEQLVNGNTVYLDGTAEESYEYEEILEQVYEDYWNDKKEEVESELIDEGYEEE